MKLTESDKIHAKCLKQRAIKPPPVPAPRDTLSRRVNYLMSLNGQHTIREMVDLLDRNVGWKICDTNLYAFCHKHDIPWKAVALPGRTRRGKGIDIHSSTSNGVGKAEYTTLNRNDYERYT